MRQRVRTLRGGMLAVLLCSLAGAAPATPEGVPTWPFHVSRLDPRFEKPIVVICLATAKVRVAGMPCSIAVRAPVTVEGEQVYLDVRGLCRHAIENDPAVSPDKKWIVSLKEDPLAPLLLINCEENLAYPYPPDDPITSPRTTPPPPPPPPPPSPPSSPPAARDGSPEDPRGALKRLKEIERRLTAIEKTLKDLDALTRGQEVLRRGMETLRKDLLEGLDKLKESRKVSCTRSGGSYGGRGEVIVSVGQRALRFLQIRPPSDSVTIGLTEEQAAELLRQVQQDSQDPVLPRIFRSVPVVSREVTELYLQDRLIDPELYALLVGGDARRVSYQDAERFVAELNRVCTGQARFALPTEEQFIVAARMLYDPFAGGLKPCSALTGSGADVQVTELLGNVWQLTRSLCEPFGPGGVDPCPEGSYVRKGGTAASANPLECLPEYRSAAPSSVAQKDTSFRLVLVE